MSKPINKITKTAQKIKIVNNKSTEILEPNKEPSKQIQNKEQKIEQQKEIKKEEIKNEKKEENKEDIIELKKSTNKDLKENIKEEIKNKEKIKKPKSNLNNMMRRTNLYFNTTQIKKYIITKINNENMTISKNIIDKEHPENKERKDINISCGNSIFALSALMDTILQYIMNEVIKNIEKNDIGLYDVKYNMIEKEIYKNNDMRYNFINYILSFNEKNINYTGLFIFNDKVIRDFIDERYTKTIKLDNKSINFFSYILIDVLNEIVNNAYILMKYYDKTQMNSNIILHICMIKFKGDFMNTIKIRLEDTMNLIEQINEENRKLNEKKKKKEENNNNKIEINEKNNEDIRKKI